MSLVCLLTAPHRSSQQARASPHIAEGRVVLFERELRESFRPGWNGGNAAVASVDGILWVLIHVTFLT